MPNVQKASCVGPSRASSDRLLVLEVSTNNDSKMLKTVSLSHGDQTLVVLCHEWQEPEIKTGHVVRVVLTEPNGRYRPWNYQTGSDEQPVFVTRDCNLLIHHPDTLIPSTAVADSFMCLRRSVLSYRTPSGKISDTAVGSEAALFGQLIHDMFQIILARDANTRDSVSTEIIDWASQGLDAESFFEAAEEALYRHKEEMFAADISDRDARLVLHKVTADIMDWYQGFMGSGNYSAAQGVAVTDGKLARIIRVSEVHDIEELIWSPVFGLKGKIDATIHLNVDGIDVGVGVLELKTGKSSGYAALYHTAQVTLYNMLLSDRKDRLINHALLTYIPYQGALSAVREDQSQASYVGDKIELLQTQSSVDPSNRHKYVVSSRPEIVGLIMQRNRLAAYLRLEAAIEDLPPLLTGKEEVCAKCFANESCLVQHKMIEGGTSQSASEGPGAALFERKTNHLRSGHDEYYRFWRMVLDVEQECARREVKEIWSLGGEEREMKGCCIAGLKLDPSTGTESNSQATLLLPGQRMEASFMRHPQAKSRFNQILTSAGISEGDYVVVSAEGRSYLDGCRSSNRRATTTWQSALGNGFVTGVSQNCITVTIERSLEAWIKHQGVDGRDVYWRLDRQEVYSPYFVATKTLETLFGANDETGIQRLRELVVERASPKYKDELKDGGSHEAVLKSQYLAGMNLNEDQENAVRLSLRAKDYVLILGMPGTGKTTTLVAVVLATALEGRSVLLCSHTNSAVDNLLRKLMDRGFDDFIRLGRNVDVIDSKIHPYHFSRKFAQCQSTASLGSQLDKPRVIATTCLGINHPLLVRRNKFDLVVVDEASQILQPICLGPLQFASGPFILVGDHYQLPPLQRTSAQGKALTYKVDAGMDRTNESKNGSFEPMALGSDKSQTESLFRRLCVAHPSAMVALTKQYRMADEIMNLANELVYGGSLTCESQEVRHQALQVSLAGLRKPHAPWLAAVLNPSAKVLFLDVEPEEATDMIVQAKRAQANTCLNDGEYRGSDERDRENETEVNVVMRVLEGLVEGGVRCAEITVLSPFRSQVHLIRGRAKRSRTCSRADLSAVEVSTIDQYQGKDNSCVVVSFVRNRLNSVGPLLKDWRRLNVALTRAKKKLILVGSGSTLRNGGKVFERMMTYLSEKDKIHRLQRARVSHSLSS